VILHATGICLACSHATHILAADTNNTTAECEIVTFIELIARSEAYDGVCVRASGVLAVGFEEGKLYMSWDFYRSRLLEYSFPVDLPSNWQASLGDPASLRKGDLVSVEGTFKAFPDGALHSGRIVDVKSIVKL
jgi:hypothetical protein